MKEMNQPAYQDDRKLHSEYQRVLLSKAIREIRNEEVHFLMARSPEDQRHLAFLAKHRENRLKKLMRHLWWNSLRDQLFTLLPGTLRFAFVALGFLCIGLTSVFASNQTFRVQVFSLFTEDHGEYTAIVLREDEQSSFDVPAEWEGMYYPSYIPDGFEVESIDNSFERDLMVTMRKQDDYDTRLIFNETSKDVDMSIDTENAWVYHTEIHGNDAIVSLKEKFSMIVWSENNRIFSIIIDGKNEEEMLRVAAGVRLIK